MAMEKERESVADRYQEDTREPDGGGDDRACAQQVQRDDDGDGDDSDGDASDAPRLNERTLLRLARGDPALVSLAVSLGDGAGYNALAVDWEGGGSISRSAHLRRLVVESHPPNNGGGIDERSNHDGGDVPGRAKAFFGDVASNRSIEHIFLDDCVLNACGDIFSILGDFFGHNRNLRSFGATQLNIDPESADIIARSLSRCGENSLRSFDLRFIFAGSQSMAHILASLGQLRSLEALILEGVVRSKNDGEWISSLVQLLENASPRLKDVRLGYNEIGDNGAAVLANVLCNKHTVRTLSLDGSLSFSSAGWQYFSSFFGSCDSVLEVLHLNSITIDDKGLSHLSAALEINSTLKELNLGRVKLVLSDRSIGWKAFMRYLKGRCSLETLYLNNNRIKDSGMKTLGDALVENTSLNALDLSNTSTVCSIGWAAFSACLRSPVCTLEKLDLSQSRIDDGGKVALASALADNTSMKEFDSACTRTVGNTLRWHVSNALLNPSSELEKLDIGYCDLDDEEARALAGALSVNNKLRSLCLDGNRTISEAGWVAFFSMLHNPASALQDLFLDHNNIDDEGAARATNALVTSSTLRTLQTSGNSSITSQGHRSLSRLVRGAKSTFETLIIDGNINDEVVISYAAAIANGSASLKNLVIGNIHGVRSRGWASMARALCNGANIGGICGSNHKLQRLCSSENEGKLPCDLVSYLEMNRCKNKNQVARRKILRCLSEGGGDIRELLEIDFRKWPRIIASAGVDYNGQSLLYRFFRIIPSLFERL